jgi:hypothetical protein
MMAHRVLTSVCTQCGHNAGRCAYKVNERGTAWGGLSLGKPVWGFYCNACGRSVMTILSATGPWD